MAQILDAATAVFAETGYEAASANAIAQRAGISPGSLYQFFSGKQAIAAALAERFLAEMRTAHADAFATSGIAELPLARLMDRIIDPIVAFNLANPGLKALFVGTDLPGHPGARELLEALAGRVEAIVAIRAPSLDATQRARCATVCLQIVRSMMALITNAPETERATFVADLKTILTRYLAPIDEAIEG
ncbi:TetR/AcrR family transcriptional regulator [Nonomuraea polychroma]|uniref:TetR/AcrR family transcriptional regulator n=1 Tax=Nonomuraea polychroma TaxID=46176 RepID=UPI003D8D7E9C